MLDSLESLSHELSGHLHYVEYDKSDLKFIKQQIQGVWWNKDVTPFARRRDEELETWCTKMHIPVHTYEDYMLQPVDLVKTMTDTVYQVYTPFYHAALRHEVRKPVVCTMNNIRFARFDGKEPSIDSYAPHYPEQLKGGRENGLLVLTRIRRGTFNDYDTARDDPGAQKTTRLAAYLKFGCVSIREAYASMKHAGADGIIRELYWREFYFYLTYHQPRLLEGQVGKVNESFRARLENVQWKYAEDEPVKWQAWCEGKTGYPIVDAGMRQLKETGYMHNRARMIVAMFLTKHLHIHWQEGERFFAKSLIDYDPCQNNGGWQWSASTGVDTQPYRIFNPWIQTTRYDPDCIYVKQWVPELRPVAESDILKWDKESTRNKHRDIEYPAPIVEHKEAVTEGKRLLQKK